MNEDNAPSGNPSQDPRGRASWFAGRSDRVALLVLLAILAITPVLGTTALAGSGGVGSGDGGGDSAKSRYARMWENMSHRDKRWAHRTSECESGQRAKIHGGGGSYHGAFQFMLSTWRSAPKSPGGDPHKRAWKTQAVVAIKLKHRDGAGHWPNCG